MIFLQSTNGQEVPFRLLNAGTPVTGASLSGITVTLWKPGNSGFGITSAGIAGREIADGWYSFILADVDTDTIGVCLMRALQVSTGYEAYVDFTIVPAPLTAPIPNNPLS